MAYLRNGLFRVAAGVALAFAFIPGAAMATGQTWMTDVMEVSDVPAKVEADPTIAAEVQASAPAAKPQAVAGAVGAAQAPEGTGAATGSAGAADVAAAAVSAPAAESTEPLVADSESSLEDQQQDGDALERASAQVQAETDRLAEERAAGEKAREEAEQAAAKKKTDYTIEYDRALIDQIGTQEQSGHTICCPSFSCAYADAVLDGTVHDHSYYTCYSCTWPDWGGGESWDRYVGGPDELLREAYDEIAAGRPTVIHVSAGYGEHWIALIGYRNAQDPDHLTLDNFVALDPWDGSQLVAGDRFSLYGDGCEHISTR